MSAAALRRQGAADKLRPGRIHAAHRADGRPLPYFLYVPASAGPETELFVSVHGLARNAVSHVVRFRALAESAGVACLAPCFSRADHRRFQHLAPGRDGIRPDDALKAVIDEVCGLLGRPAGPAAFFGYSGGGQFVHRYAMRHPDRVRAAVLAAPGWFTFPDPAAPFPYGLAAGGTAPAIDIEPFLRIPVSVIVGDRDKARDDALNKSPAIDRAQGANRLERAQNWVAAVGAACAARNLRPNAELFVLPHAGHCFEQNMDRRGLGRLVFERLFSPVGEMARAAAAGQ
jgi:pimeloyl-ACP methyl ester carboxylesterase